MNIAILVILIMAVLGGLSFILSQTGKPAQTKCKVVKAGKVADITKVSPLTATINSLDNKKFVIDGKPVDIHDYELFVVDGESMRQRDIHTGNGLLVSRLNMSEKHSLRAKDLIVLELDTDLTQKLHGKECGIHGCPIFKLREFLGYIPDKETLKTRLSDLGVNDSMELFDKTLKKFDIVRQHYNGSEPLLLSDTYDNSGRCFSFHSARFVYGKVIYVMPKQVIKF
ncbi:MAG: hypothetical protein K2L78_05715 [Muribaculaceae bacterium]|nr:hypothetical protein [Muribaculaceae bacterium]